MAKGFNRKSVTIGAATAANLAALLVAEGYAGHMAGAFLEIDATTLGDLLMADSATNIATEGRPVSIFTRMASALAAVDPSRIWLISATGGDFAVTFDPL